MISFLVELVLAVALKYRFRWKWPATLFRWHMRRMTRKWSDGIDLSTDDIKFTAPTGGRE